jgi:hypothetical protein
MTTMRTIQHNNTTLRRDKVHKYAYTTDPFPRGIRTIKGKYFSNISPPGD